MRALNRKLLRDLLRLRSQAVAIALVMACGVATFVMSLSMLDSLTGALDRYYQQSRFAHVFASLKRAPVSIADRTAEIPGVAHVQHRLVERVILDMPAIAGPASGVIVSLPEQPHEGVNLLHLRLGRFPHGRAAREVLVSQRFAEAHGLSPGDGVRAILNGRLQTLRIVGIALSPEHIYLIAPGSILPDNERFGVFWMGRDELEAALDMQGAFNDLAIRLMPGANQQEIIDRIDNLTAPYGGLGAHGRDDQVSHKFVANEIEELRGMTLIVPVVFLAVAAFLLNIVLSRIIASQREQIAALRALGYTAPEIGRHYLALVLLIAAVAAIVGVAAGAQMGRGLTAMYVEFFDFPTFDYLLHPRVVVLGVAASIAAAALGVATALRAAMRLPPAEAMRPASPPAYRPTVIERAGLQKLVPLSARMIVRHLERRPLKAALSILGIAMAGAIVVLGGYTEDAIDYLMDFQFNRVQRYGAAIALADQTDSTALSTIAHMPGVIAAEPFRSLSVRIRSGHRSRRTGVQALTTADGLHRLLDMSGRPLLLPDRGVVLSSVLAERLGVAIGDDVTIESLEGRRRTFRVPVAALIDDFSGLSIYMRLAELNRLLAEPGVINGAYLSVDPTLAEPLYARLREAPRIVAVNIKAATVRSFRETVSKNLGLMRAFLLAFAVIIAFGVIYNSARISLSERSRDLATLRVVGFTRREVAAIQLGELALLTLLAIPLGLAIGAGLSWISSQAADAELIRVPFIIHPSSFAVAAIVVAAASAVSGLIVRRRIDKLDLLSVLKARE